MNSKYDNMHKILMNGALKFTNNRVNIQVNIVCYHEFRVVGWEYS